MVVRRQNQNGELYIQNLGTTHGGRVQGRLLFAHRMLPLKDLRVRLHA